jgi:hypothetical protein
MTEPLAISHKEINNVPRAGRTVSHAILPPLDSLHE